MATTLLIENTKDATLTITSQNLYDVIILPEAPHINTSGQVISVFHSMFAASFDSLENSYSLHLGKSDALLVVGGNYGENGLWPVGRDLYSWREYPFDPVATFGGLKGSYLTVDNRYNVYHTSVNNDFITGAIHFSGSDAKLVLASQIGSSKADQYHTSTENPAQSEDYKKTDDGIRLRSDNYGLFTPYKELFQGNSPYVAFHYGNVNEPAAPDQKTVSYTIHAENTLTVISDLAGQIETNVAGMRSHYWTFADKKYAPTHSCGNYQIKGAGVYAGTLVLDANFRANITVTNNSKLFRGTFLNGNGNDVYVDFRGASDYINVYERTAPYEKAPTVTQADFDNGLRVYGTTIAGSYAVNNNEVINYGVHTDDALRTAVQSVWNGVITVDTSDVKILASFDHLGAIEEKKLEEAMKAGASASNNKIGAYGIHSDGSIEIAAMDALRKDWNGTSDRNATDDGENTRLQDTVINVIANNNRITSSGLAAEKPETTVGVDGSSITVAGIYGNSVTLGRVSDKVYFNITARNNLVDDDHPEIDRSSHGDVYGIHGGTLTLSNFNGNITIDTDSASSYGLSGNNFTSTTNLYGLIKIGEKDDNGRFQRWDGVGIKAGSLTVHGVIDSKISARVGIYASSLDTDGFTGDITAYQNGIVINRWTGSVFNIAGTIEADQYAVVCMTSLNLRVSGTVSGGSYAIRSEYSVDLSGQGYINSSKFDDRVEIAHGARVTGKIDLGAGINRLIINSTARVNGTVVSEAGELNLAFELDEHIAGDNGYTLYMADYNQFDKTINDAGTITIDLNYAKAGTYNLIHYGYNADQFWNNHNRPIAFRFQGKSYNTNLVDTDDGCEGTFPINIGEHEATVTARYDNATNSFTVTIEGDLPPAGEVCTRSMANAFATEIVKVENGSARLDWSMLNSYVREKISAGTLKDAGGKVISEYGSYQIAYAILREDGSQIGDIIYKEVNGTALNVNLTEAAMNVSNASVSDIDSVKIVNISMLGQDEDGHGTSIGFDFSPIIAEKRDEEHNVEISWDTLHDNFMAQIAAGTLESVNGATITELDHYLISYEVLSPNGVRQALCTAKIINGESSYTVNLEKAAAVYGGRYSEIGSLRLLSVELVDIDGRKTAAAVPAEAESTFIFDETDPDTYQYELPGFNFNWGVLDAEIQRKLEMRSLKSNTGETITGISHYTINYITLDKYGNRISAGVLTSEIRDGFECRIPLTAEMEDAGVANIKIVDISITGLDAVGNECSLSYEFPQGSASQIVDGINLHWEELAAELQDSLEAGALTDIAHNPVAAINGYRIEYAVKDLEGNVLGTLSASVIGDNYTVRLDEAAAALNIPREDIGSVELLNVFTRGDELNTAGQNVDITVDTDLDSVLAGEVFTVDWDGTVGHEYRLTYSLCVSDETRPISVVVNDATEYTFALADIMAAYSDYRFNKQDVIENGYLHVSIYDMTANEALTGFNRAESQEAYVSHAIADWDELAAVLERDLQNNALVDDAAGTPFTQISGYDITYQLLTESGVVISDGIVHQNVLDASELKVYIADVIHNMTGIGTVGGIRISSITVKGADGEGNELTATYAGFDTPLSKEDKVCTVNWDDLAGQLAERMEAESLPAVGQYQVSYSIYDSNGTRLKQGVVTVNNASEYTFNFTDELDINNDAVRVEIDSIAITQFNVEQNITVGTGDVVETLNDGALTIDITAKLAEWQTSVLQDATGNTFAGFDSWTMTVELAGVGPVDIRFDGEELAALLADGTYTIDNVTNLTGGVVPTGAEVTNIAVTGRADYAEDEVVYENIADINNIDWQPSWQIPVSWQPDAFDMTSYYNPSDQQNHNVNYYLCVPIVQVEANGVRYELSENSPVYPITSLWYDSRSGEDPSVVMDITPWAYFQEGDEELTAITVIDPDNPEQEITLRVEDIDRLVMVGMNYQLFLEGAQENEFVLYQDRRENYAHAFSEHQISGILNVPDDIFAGIAENYDGDISNYSVSYRLYMSDGTVHVIAAQHDGGEGNQLDLTGTLNDLNSGNPFAITDFSTIAKIEIESIVCNKDTEQEFIAYQDLSSTDITGNNEFTLVWDEQRGNIVEALESALGEGRTLDENTISYVIDFVLKDASGNVIDSYSRTVGQDELLSESSYRFEYDHNAATAEIVRITASAQDDLGNDLGSFTCAGFQPENSVREEKDCFVLNWANQGVNLWEDSTITFALIGKSGKPIAYFDREIIRGATTYNVDKERYAEELGIEVDDIVGAELVRVNGNFEHQIDNYVEYTGIKLNWQNLHDQWMQDMSAGRLRDIDGMVLTDFSSYDISYRVYYRNGDIADEAAAGLSAPEFLVRFDEHGSSDIDRVEITGITIRGTHGAFREYNGDDFDVENNASKIMVLDWSTLDQELRQKIEAGLLISNGADDNGASMEKLDDYTISYCLYDNFGNRLGFATEENVNASSLTVYLDEAAERFGCSVNDISSIKLTNVIANGKNADDVDVIYGYTWSQSGSMVENFVENYHADENSLVISWYGIEAEDYGLVEIAAYEIEYTLYDKDGRKIGESIAVQIDGDENSCTIRGVDANTEVRWRFRLLGDNTATRVSAWSEERIAKEVISVNSPSKFNSENFRTDVLDSTKENATGVVAAVATLSWDGLESAKSIAKYVVEYCELSQQITQDMLDDGVSVEQYIAGDLFDENLYNTPIYKKVISGEKLVISKLQNQSYIYWRIKAVDINGGISDWYAGSTFRVWTDADSTAPIFSNRTSEVLDVNFPGVEYVRPDANDKKSTYNVHIGWNLASDDESGVRCYFIELSSDGGHTFTQYKQVDVEDKVPWSGAVWRSSLLDADTQYRVMVHGEGDAANPVYITDTVVKNVDGHLALVWNRDEDLAGKTVTIQYYDGFNWMELAANVDDFDFKRYDYSCTLDGLVNNNYQYRIIAVDYFGNRVSNNNAASGTIHADVSAPVFEVANRPATLANYAYDDGGSNLQSSVQLTGDILWAAATDSESKIRKYVVKFSSDGGSTYDRTHEFSIVDLDKKVSCINFNAMAVGSEIYAGQYYTIVIAGEGEQGITVKATANGVLRLDRYIPDLDGREIRLYSASAQIYTGTIDNDAMISVLENKTTRLTIDDVIAGGEYYVTFAEEDGSVSELVVIASNDGELFVDRDVRYKNIRITAGVNGTEIFNGAVTNAMSSLYYRINIGDFEQRLEASSYHYQITGYDYFEQATPSISGDILADNTAPVFANTETAVCVSNVMRDEDSGSVTYNTVIAWHNAVDNPGNDGAEPSNIRYYTIKVSFDGGRTWSESVVEPEDDRLQPRSLAVWKGNGEHTVDPNNQYRVMINGQDYDAGVTLYNGEQCVNWAFEGSLEGRQVDIQYFVDNNWVTIAGNVSGSANGFINGSYKYTDYECSWFVEGESGKNVSYQIFANDICGNQSSVLQGTTVIDSGAPSFVGRCEITVNDPVVDEDGGMPLTPSFSWKAAQDRAGDLGIHRYEIYIRAQGTEEWILETTIYSDGRENYSWTPGESREWGVYEYKLVAYDYFGNDAVLNGTFGTPDVKGPIGMFDSDSCKATVDAVYDVIPPQPVVDEFGNPVLDENGEALYTPETRGALLSAKVTLSWASVSGDNRIQDEHGSQIWYKVTVSNSTGGNDAVAYDFWTTETSIVFDNETLGRNIGLFENMNEIYWQVQAYDEYLNYGSSYSPSSPKKSFTLDFTDKYGTIRVKNPSKVMESANKSVTTEFYKNENGTKLTGNAGVSWHYDDQLMGVYKFDIVLKDMNGNVVYSGSTLDAAVPKNGADVSEWVTVDKASDSYTISDLCSFFGVASIRDGRYTMDITAYDTNGRKGEVGKNVEFVMDTQAPGQVMLVGDPVIVTENFNGNSGGTPYITWHPVEDSSGIDYYEVSYSHSGLSSELFTRVYGDTMVKLGDDPVGEGTTYTYKIVAVDKAGNRGQEWLESKTVVVTADQFKDSINAAEYQTGNSIRAKDSVGKLDLADMFKLNVTENGAAFSLTVNSLYAIDGKQNIIITIYKNGASWKKYSVKDTGRIFSDLLMERGTYCFSVTAADSNSITSYDIQLNKKNLGGGNNDTSDNSYSQAIQNGDVLVISNAGSGEFSDWVGFGDVADVRYLQSGSFTSGKYTFNLSGVAGNVTLAVYEYAGSKAVKLASVTGTATKVDGISTKSLLLDSGKSYYVMVTPGSGIVGSDFTVGVTRDEAFRSGANVLDNREDTARSLRNEAGEIVTPEDDWVGFGDAVNYRKLLVSDETLTLEGGVYNFTIARPGGAAEDEAVKLNVYRYVNGRKVTVKTVTLAAGKDAVSTGMLYLTGGDDGNCFVEVSAPGAAKALNSDYQLSIDGFDITSSMVESDEANKTPAVLGVGAGVTGGYVGVEDKADLYTFTANQGATYEFKLENVNGKEIKATLGYIIDGVWKSLGVTAAGTAGADVLTLSKYFDDKTMAKVNGGELCIKVEANGTKANSMYDLSMKLLAADTDNDSTATELGLSAGTPDNNGWVGITDPVDYWRLDVADGFYDVSIGGAENPLKFAVIQKDLATGKESQLKAVTVNGVNGGGVISGVCFDTSRYEYFAAVTATGAKSGKNSDYSLELVSQMSGLTGNHGSGSLSTADLLDVYTVNVNAGDIRSFEFSGMGTEKNRNLKVTIISAATGKSVKSFTTTSGVDAQAVSYAFKEGGEYYVKIEAAGKGKIADYALDVIARADDSNSDWATAGTLTAGTPENDWVGQGDAKDCWRVDPGAYGTGVYDLTLGGLDNTAKVTLYEQKSGAAKPVAVKPVSGTLYTLDANNGSTYYAVVQASAVSGTKDTDYELSLNQVSQSVLDGDSLENVSTVGVANWVGFGDDKDYYRFTASDVNSITITLDNDDEVADVKLVIKQGSKTVKTLTVNAKSREASTGDICLSGDYTIEVQAVNAKKGANADYVVNVGSWSYADYRTANNGETAASELTTSCGSVQAVSKKDDAVDFYSVYVANNGNYSLELTGINGNAIKVSIGMVVNGKFKVLQSVTGKAGADELTLSRALTGGTTYYYKVEAVGTAGASKYTMAFENNDGLVNSADRKICSSADDTKALVAGDVEAVLYQATAGSPAVIEDWVGFGDTQDVFHVKTADNSQLVFQALDGDTADALIAKEITLTLVDVNGKSVALTFDKESGNYISKNMLMADGDYYLTVKSAKPKERNTDYSIAVSCVEL